MSLSSCLWPPMKLKFKSTEGTLSGKNRSVWNQSTVEWRKIICSSLGYWTFLLSIVNVYRTGFHKEFPIFKKPSIIHGVVSHRDTFMHGHIIHWTYFLPCLWPSFSHFPSSSTSNFMSYPPENPGLSMKPEHLRRYKYVFHGHRSALELSITTH